jgi:hypothetical protein
VLMCCTFVLTSESIVIILVYVTSINGLANKKVDIIFSAHDTFL